MSNPRCFICLRTYDSHEQPLYYCCKEKVAHEKCFIDYISTRHGNWICNTCHDEYAAQLSGSSFWLSIFATNIQSRAKMSAISFIFAVECIVGFLIQLMIAAYIAKAILWVITHQSSFYVSESLSFTIRPDVSDLLLGLIAYLVWIPPWILILFIARITCYRGKAKKENSDFLFGPRSTFS